MTDLKPLFQLDPSIVFLNHGSFGACPQPVFDVYQEWQRRIERQPVLVLGRQMIELDRQARQALGECVHADPDDLVFVPNATHGVNIVARSLRFEPGDEILTTNQEYGACEYALEFICAHTGARLVRLPLPLPCSPEEVAERIWDGVTRRTRLIFFSHITSSTAQRFPVGEVCHRAHAAGIRTLVDGAHAPGQVPLDLEALGADFYTGNCHKWMMAPKGAGFLYACRDQQAQIEPLVVSWGYHATPETTSRSTFVDYLQWTGTRDPSAYLAVPAAIQFMREHHWDEVRRVCSTRLSATLERLSALTGMPPVYTVQPEAELAGPLPPQMGIIPLPEDTPVFALKERLYNQFCIEIPAIEWNGRPYLRLSVQGYNTQADLDALCQALEEVLGRR